MAGSPRKHVEHTDEAVVLPDYGLAREDIAAGKLPALIALATRAQLIEQRVLAIARFRLLSHSTSVASTLAARQTVVFDSPFPLRMSARATPVEAAFVCLAQNGTWGRYFFEVP